MQHGRNLVYICVYRHRRIGPCPCYIVMNVRGLGLRLVRLKTCLQRNAHNGRLKIHPWSFLNEAAAKNFLVLDTSDGTVVDVSPH